MTGRAREKKKNATAYPRLPDYRRLKEWTLTLYDKDGKAYHVNPKMVMEKNDEQRTISGE